MSVKSLAVKYRPNVWEDVTEQVEVVVILKQQLETNTFKNAYLFCGPAGCGKTTCARIFANEINKGQGNPIELDAASNNSVDDMRELIQQAKSKSLDSEYKIFIVDECHMITTAGWNALLKLIEEPPAKSIFIFATTDPQKIPKTILSRVQRYDFRMISMKGIANRLDYILSNEMTDEMTADRDAVEYIAKLSEGHMRDAITMMDKAMSFSDDLTLENVVKALGTTDYETMFKLTDKMIDANAQEVIEIIEKIHADGKDLKQFVHLYTNFLLDVQKYAVGCDFSQLQIPQLKDYEEWLNGCGDAEFEYCEKLLRECITLNSDIKYSAYPKADIEAKLLILCLED